MSSPQPDQTLLDVFRQKGCTAYQAMFAAEFLRPDGSLYHLLAGPAGSGKTYVANHIVSYMFEHQMAHRVLVLTPAALAPMWHGHLADVCGQVPNTVLTRQAYRELLTDSPVGQLRWPRPLIAVGPIDTAKQDDIAESLAQSHWDAIIVDESHLLSAPQRMALLERLFSANAVGRLLLMTATPLPFFEPFLAKHTEHSPLPLPELSFTDWFTGLRDWEGKPVAPLPVQMITVDYRRGADEVEFLQTLQGGLRQLETDRTGAFVSRMLVRRAESSIFAVEQSLQRLHRTLVSNAPLREDKEPTAADISDSDDMMDRGAEELLPNPPWEDKQAALQWVEACLTSLECVQSDAKCSCLTSLLKQLASCPSSKICVMSSFVDSLAYLQSALDLDIPCELVTGGQTLSERHDTIDRFVREGTLLLATDALSEGMSLPQVTHVVHFDLPWSPVRLAQRQGRFDRIGRTQPLKMYYLRDTSGALPSEQLLERLIAKVQELRKTGLLPDSVLQLEMPDRVPHPE